MGQKPINERGGVAATVQAKMPDADVARLVALAARRRKSRSAMARELLVAALDQLETAGTGPSA